MIYVMSDIHGNLRRFESVLSQIDIQPADTLYILGDVIDRHPHGIRILRRIMAAPNMKMLLGNHEFMMLRALNHPYEPGDRDFDPDASVTHWYRNGGGVTHRHLKHLRKTLRAEIISYLRSLPLNIDIEVNGTPYKLVHAAPVELYTPHDLYTSPTHFAVWKRWPDDTALLSDRTVIFGHTPTRYFQPNCPMEIYRTPDRIGIDCGSGYPEDPSSELRAFGRLACLRLDDGKVFYSEE